MHPFGSASGRGVEIGHKEKMPHDRISREAPIPPSTPPSSPLFATNAAASSTPESRPSSRSNPKLVKNRSHIEVVTLLPDPVTSHLHHEAGADVDPVLSRIDRTAGSLERPLVS